MMMETSKDMDLEKLAGRAIIAAVMAGEEILSVYQNETEVYLKADKSPLTEADRRAHDMIVRTLEDTGLPLLSEEGRDIPFAERSVWRRFWLVDPLDGTKEFIKRNGEFTVNIAMIEKGMPVFGVVYAPVTGILYAGILGKGSFKTTISGESWKNAADGDSWAIEILKNADSLPLPAGNRPFTIVASRSHNSTETTAYIDTERMRHPDLELISIGSSLKICLVAEGSADTYPRFAPTMEWDTAAGHAVAAYAGKSAVTTDDAKPLQYNKENLTNPWFVVQ